MTNLRYLNRLVRKARSGVFRQVYRDTKADLSRALMISGAARSGTTWVAEVVGSQTPSRLIFEPFYPTGVPEFEQFRSMQYIPPGSENPDLHRFVQRVLLGQIKGPWVDHQIDCVRPQQRIIKAVRANLMLRWLSDQFPGVPIVFMIRHPCAVVASRMEAGWSPEDDLESMLGQQQLRTDFPSISRDRIAACASVEERHALCWCIQHLIPLKHLIADRVHLVFFENLCTDPGSEMPKLFAALGRPFDDSVYDAMNRSSRMTSTAHMGLASKERVTGWQQQLSKGQQEQILAVVDAFELSHLYGQSATPEIEPSEAYLE